MKKQFAYILFLLFLSSCSDKLYSDFWTPSTGVLYKYVSNPIRININQSKPDSVTIDNGIIKKVDSDYYTVSVDTGYYSNLTVWSGGRKKEINFRIKPIPLPIIEICTDSMRFSNAEVSSSVFKSFKLLMPRLINFDYECSMIIDSYKMTRINEEKSVETFEFDNAISENKYFYSNYLIRNADSGDIFFFTDIVLSIYVVGKTPHVYDKKCESLKAKNIYAITLALRCF